MTRKTFFRVEVLVRFSYMSMPASLHMLFISLIKTLGMKLTLHGSVDEGLKVKVRKFVEVIPSFKEVTGVKLKRFLRPIVLNRNKV